MARTTTPTKLISEDLELGQAVIDLQIKTEE